MFARVWRSIWAKFLARFLSDSKVINVMQNRVFLSFLKIILKKMN